MIFTEYRPSYSNTIEEVYRDVFDIPTREQAFNGGKKATLDGGKAIASGGYGCVFRPALKCKNENEIRKGAIAKLMTKEHAESEMREIEYAQDIIQSIPNYHKYFAITDYHMCVPASLTNEDKISFNEKCASPLQKTFSRVNKTIKSYRAIISPDLGLDLSKAIKQSFSDRTITKEEHNHLLKNLINLNETASNLLENGIAKLAKLNFYHSDVKPQNIMTNFNDNIQEKSFTQMKLIDFGLALPYKADWKFVNSFPMFNAPVSSFMFNDSILKSINEKLTRSRKYIGRGKQYDYVIDEHIRSIVKKNVFETSSFTHVPYMTYLGSKAYNLTKKKYRDFLENFFTNYCKQVVFSFIKRSKYPTKHNFDIEKYWQNVYRHNLDVWGFLTSFLLISAEAQSSQPEISAQYLKIVDTYLYNLDWTNKPIPVNGIIALLKNITDHFKCELLPSKHYNEMKMVEITKPKATTIKKRKLIIVKDDSINKEKTSSKKNQSVITLKGKRCPNGYKRDKKNKTKCVKHDYKYKMKTRTNTKTKTRTNTKTKTRT